MKLQTLQNIQIFLKRVPVTGEESIAWCQASAEVADEIAAQTSPPPSAIDKSVKNTLAGAKK